MKQLAWKPISIEVCEDGRVRFLGQLVTTRRSSNGYHSIGLTVHRLVALGFHGPPPADGEYWVVDHIDGNPANNAASNLRWLTQAENTRTHFRGKSRMLSAEQVAEIESARPQDTTTLAELAHSFGVSVAAVAAIRTGHTHPGGYSKTNRTVLTKQQVAAIRAWAPPSPTAAALGRHYKVSPATILNIWHGRY